MTTWPPELTLRTVEIDISTAGTVWFTGPVLAVTAGDVLTDRISELAVTDTAGVATIVLPATKNVAGVLPSSWMYGVTIRRGEHIDRGTLELDAAGPATVALADLLQLAQNVEPGVSYAKLDADGDVTDAAGNKILGGGGGGGTPSGTVVAETSFGQASSAGNASTWSRGNHTHGTPAAPTAASVGADASGTAAAAVAAHAAAGDPHAQYLTAAEGAAAYQPLDGDLTAIAALTATTDNIIQSVGGAWSSRTPAQARTALTLVPSILLGPSDPIPGGTPANTLVIRTT